MTIRRVLGVLVVVVVAAAAYTGWLAWQIQSQLRAAESSATALQDAWRSGDAVSRDRAEADLADEAAAAEGHTSGLWWRTLGHLPLVGDDVDGVSALSRSLDILARDAVAPLGETADAADRVIADGRIDLERVARLEQPVTQAAQALVAADDQVAGLDSSGFLGPLRSRFDRYADLVHGLRSGLSSAETAVAVLPEMAGADGPRDYLLLFQNNAEIRPTGGMPGAWALLHAEDGAISLTRQGSASDFPHTDQPVLPLTDEEIAVYGKEVGTYFQNPGWTFDFPRAAELWQAHWDARYPDEPIDGVMAVDPVALSYLLAGTGPVTVGEVTLTEDNAVEELLNRPYIEADTVTQDAFFAEAARAIFDAATSSLASPTAFLEGLDRAAGEGRLLVAPFDAELADEIAGTRVEGALTGDDGATPHVDIGLSDLTGSKMSYYLRYSADVEATACDSGVQELAGTVTLRQSISPAQAASLPVSVTGGGTYGTDPGSQYVMVRLYGPYDGSLDRVMLNGRALEPNVRTVNGRAVVSIDVLLSSTRDVVLTWSATVGEGQVADGLATVTPGVRPGSSQFSFRSGCD